MSDSVFVSDRIAQLRAEAMAELRAESPEIFRILELPDDPKGIEPSMAPAVRAASVVIQNRARRLLLPDIDVKLYEVIEEDGTVIQSDFTSIGIAQAFAENRFIEFGSKIKFRVRRKSS